MMWYWFYQDWLLSLHIVIGFFGLCAIMAYLFPIKSKGGQNLPHEIGKRPPPPQGSAVSFPRVPLPERLQESGGSKAVISPFVDYTVLRTMTNPKHVEPPLHQPPDLATEIMCNMKEDLKTYEKKIKHRLDYEKSLEYGFGGRE